MGKGFILDDWDIGFQSDIKLHRTPTADDIQDGYEEDELIDDYDLPAHWLMMQMNNFCVGANYVFLNGKHYYTVHHSQVVFSQKFDNTTAGGTHESKITRSSRGT